MVHTLGLLQCKCLIHKQVQRARSSKLCISTSACLRCRHVHQRGVSAALGTMAMDRSILDDLGQEVTGEGALAERAVKAVQECRWIDALRGPLAGIVAPVTLCIAITVLLVRVLNPSGASNSAVMKLATISYDEKVGALWKRFI